MNIKRKAGELLKKYKHAWVFSYALIYMPWFAYLEKHVTRNYHVIHSVFDDKIPFVEYFVVPYLLWFVFILLPRYSCISFSTMWKDFINWRS